jgi:2-polyprenyl-3-methyl-5-hydroxy-6-metoxy-1,4-benzoquinol methylase
MKNLGTNPLINRQEPLSAVNLDDPRQDVHRERIHDPNLNRYRVAEGLLPEASQGLSVLEIGGGIGEFSRRMLARGIRVTFVDLSEHNIEKAKGLGMPAHRIDLNTGLPVLPENTFDGVVILEVIEHIVAAELLLREINRVLKPGGFLILSTPNFAYFLNRLHILAGKLSMDEGYHYRFFTRNSLETQLANAGFAIDRHAHTVPAMGVNIFRNRLLGRPRLHVHVPRLLAPLFAHTLFVRAHKDDKALRAQI